MPHYMVQNPQRYHTMRKANSSFIALPRRHKFNPTILTLFIILCFGSLFFLNVDSNKLLPNLFTHATQTQQPTAANLSHPRIFFNAADLPAMRAKAATTHEDIWLIVQGFTESELGTAPPSVAPSDGGLNTYRYYGNVLIAHAFSCVITQQANYCNLAKNYLLTFATWDQWGEDNIRDLGHAHMLLGNALAYDWLYDQLTPAERTLVRNSLADWAGKMYAASVEDKNNDWANWWRKSYVQNHYATNHSALGIAGLVLLDEEAEAQLWVDRAAERMGRLTTLLNQSDGSWHESINYQNYLLSLSMPFMTNLDRLQDVDVIPHEYLENYVYWRIYNHLQNETGDFIMAYGDFEWEWGNNYTPQLVLRYIASSYGNGYAQWMAHELTEVDGSSSNQYTAPWNVFHFFYYDPSVQVKSPEKLPLSRLFEDLEGVIWRTGWDENALIFGLKTGPYGGRAAHETFISESYPWEAPCNENDCQLNLGHGHDDTNSFYIYKNGSWLAPETVVYGGPDTAYSNTMLIDGQGQYRPSEGSAWRLPEELRDRDGKLVSAVTSTSFNYLIADATNRYRHLGNITAVTRHVLFIRPDYFVMVDALAAEEPHTYEWVSHFEEQVTIEGNWVKGVSDNNQILGVAIAAPQSFAADTGNDGQAYVHIRPDTDQHSVRFSNILFPTTAAKWAQRPTVSTLADSGSATALQIAHNDGSGRTDTVLVVYNHTGDPQTIGDYQTDAYVAAIITDENGDLETVFLNNGTTLIDSDSGRDLIQNALPNQVIELNYKNNTLSITGHINEELTIYAPEVTQVNFNNIPLNFVRLDDYIYINHSFEQIYLPSVIN